MLRLEKLVKTYKTGDQALQAVDIEIPEGQVLALIGPSGAGKSTLLKLITAIEPATHGTIIFENQNLGQVKNASIPYIRRKFGLVFQDHKLLYDRNCFENIALPLEINGVEINDIRGRVRAALDKVGLLNREKSMPISLSGGEQQRLAIARAIACRPSILLADEPTGNLDKKYADEIMNLFYSFQELGVTVIIATHEMPIVSKKHKQLYLQDGNLIKMTEQ